LRHGWRIPGKLLGLLLSCEVACPVPERLFLPHPTGIICGEQSVLHNDVVLMQQVTLGCRRPYQNAVPEFGYPILKEGAYIGPGARIMGRVTIGEWSVIGANAVVTADVPPFGVVVGHNRILEIKSTNL
jgi:serine O-acetyltransferase